MRLLCEIFTRSAIHMKVGQVLHPQKTSNTSGKRPIDTAGRDSRHAFMLHPGNSVYRPKRLSYAAYVELKISVIPFDLLKSSHNYVCLQLEDSTRLIPQQDYVADVNSSPTAIRLPILIRNRYPARTHSTKIPRVRSQISDPRRALERTLCTSCASNGSRR